MMKTVWIIECYWPECEDYVRVNNTAYATEKLARAKLEEMGSSEDHPRITPLDVLQ